LGSRGTSVKAPIGAFIIDPAYHYSRKERGTDACDTWDRRLPLRGPR
jgi:hypothetical protein